MKVIKVIIPAYNEENSIGKVIRDIPDTVQEIIVVNNGSTDQTAANAEAQGATVLHEPRKGYGFACLKGIEHIDASDEKADIVVFLDGDYSDYPDQLPLLTGPIEQNEMDMVIGARVKAYREPGAMTPQQVFGNALACTLMKWFYGAQYTDLGPFRAIRFKTLKDLKMEDKTYGWTVEMQLKALKQRLRYTEVPVKYRNRIGVSKVSGTVKGTVMAGYKILGWIFKYSLKK